MTLPRGEYAVEVVSCDTDRFALIPELRVVTGDHAGVQFTVRLPLTNATRSLFFRYLSEFGIGIREVAEASGMAQLATMLIGKIAVLPVSWQEDEERYVLGMP